MPSREDGGDDGGGLLRLDERPAVELGGAALGTAEERGPELHPVRAEGERRRDPAAVHDPARVQHRERDLLDDGGHERDPADQAVLERPEERPPVAARLARLRDDHVDSAALERHGLLDRRRGAEDHAARLPDLLEGRDAEGEAEHGDALLGDHRELLLDAPGRGKRGRRLRLGQPQLGPEGREHGVHRRDRAWIDDGLGERREEVDPEGPIRQPPHGGDGAAQLVRCELGARERAEPARVRDGGDQLGRRVAPRHRGLHDRVPRPEELRDEGCEWHRRVARPLEAADEHASPDRGRRRPAGRAGRSRGTCRACNRRSRTRARGC